jgi:Tol biopolymer transport system component
VNQSGARVRRAALLALVVASAVVWTASPVSTNSHAAEDQPWSIENPGGPTTRLEYTASEGTWMSVDVSPDGRNLAFDLLGHIYEMPIAGGEARPLTDGRSWNLSPRYSPDGSRIAFTSDRSGNFDVWVLERQSGTLRNISNALQNVVRPSWAADGRRVFAGAAAGLTAYGLRGEATVLVENRSGVASADPAGKHLYFEQGRPLYPFEFNPYVVVSSGARIERHDFESGATDVYLERPGGAFNPAVSPDGRTLAYLNRQVDDTILILQDLQTREERIVLRGLEPDRQEGGGFSGPYSNMAWHPDGRQIFVSFAGGIHAVNTASGQATRIAFRAPVRRELTETLRFPTAVPEKAARTRSHRWASRTASGVLHEALGDLWLGDGDRARNLTSSDAHETSPVWDPATSTVYYASWTDDEHGAVYALRTQSGEREKLSTIPSQYGSLALSSDGKALAYVRGTGGLERGLWLSNETQFELVLRESGGERVLTTVNGRELQYANFAAKIPPNVLFGPDGQTIFFTEFVEDVLVLKRIGRDGANERVLYRFPHAAEAALSPDLQWIAFREYHRSFVTPFQAAGPAVTVSAFDKQGPTLRVDGEDGGYFSWSRDGKTLGWTRAAAFYEKDVAEIVKEDERGGLTAAEQAASAEQWRERRVPGSTARRTDLARNFSIDEPTTTVALTGVRVITMNPQRSVLENATVLISGHRIAAVGSGVKVPADARVFNLAGHTVMPGLVDAHAHPHIDHSALHVIEQRPPYFHGALAYGVTTMMEVYGNEFRDGWMSDMLMAGKITGPRLFTTGSPIYGSRAGRVRMYRPFDTLAGAREQLRWNQDHGAIAVKDYAQSTRKRRHLTAMAARDLGLNVLSESSGNPQMNLTQILDGVTGIEHSMGLASFYDDMVRFWSASKAGMTPTLIVQYGGRMGEGWMHQRERLWEDKKLTRFILPEHLMRLRRTTHMWPEDYYARTMASALRKLYAAGTSLHVGAHGQLLGLDTHWELEILADGGFSPLQALEIGTIQGAAHLGLDRFVGSVEPGKLADLVVLRENPLQDIKNSKSIRYVVKNGVVYAGEDASRVFPNPRPAGSMYFRLHDRPTGTGTAASPGGRP